MIDKIFYIIFLMIGYYLGNKKNNNQKINIIEEVKDLRNKIPIPKRKIRVFPKKVVISQQLEQTKQLDERQG